MFNLNLIVILLNIFLFILCQTDEESTLKAFSCINVITQKFKGEKPEPSVFSPLMLSCFIKITKEQAQKILSDVREGKNSITNDDINKLTNIENLKGISVDELKKQSNILENTMKLFQTGNKDNVIKNKNNINKQNNEKISAFKSFLILLKKGLKNILKSFNNIWVSIFIATILYSILKIIRKCFTKDKKNKKNEKGEKSEKIKDNKKNKKEKNKNE